MSNEILDINATKTALIVIDPQHDFCSERGALALRFGLDMAEVKQAVPALNALIHACREASIPVVWVREVFADSKMLPNQKRLWGSGDDIWLIREDGTGIDWYEDMTPPLDSEEIITKWQYDAFADTDLDLLLRSRDIDTLLMTGFTTNVCVETSSRHAYSIGYNIVAVSDCAAATSVAEHEAALFNIATYFGQVRNSADLRLKADVSAGI